MKNKSKQPSEFGLDTLRLALSIAEGPTLKVGGLKLIGSRSRAFKELLEHGALVLDGKHHSITCQECDRRHRALVTFDRERQAMTYFCSEAGRVAIDARALNVYTLRLEWLLDWLADAFRISAKQRPFSLIENHLWELGQANIHHQQLRVMLARHIGSLGHLTQIETITARRTGKTGVILTTSSGFSQPHRLPNGFSMIGLQEVLAEDQSAASIDLDRLLTIVEPEAIIDPYSTGMPGRRSGAHFIKAEHERRIADDKALERIGDEARELERWYVENHRDGPPLAAGRIENLIRERHNIYKSGLSSTK